MSLFYLFSGFLVGAFIAFPIGPIGILCLRRFVVQGPAIGIASGFGGAAADIVYASIAVIGLSFVSTFIAEHSIIFRIISALFLFILGVVIFITPPPKPKATWTRGILEAFFSTLLLTLTNPLLIFSFGAMFAAWGINFQQMNGISLLLLIAGVFLGSTIWWLVLGVLSSLFTFQMQPYRLQRINAISGILIIIFSISTLLSIAFK